MNIQIGGMSGGSINIGGTSVICPECQNGQNFNHVNISGRSGTLQCGACRVWLVITDGRIEIDT